MPNNTKLSVIIPCYNSEKIIESVVKETIDVITELGYLYEIILVNDNSSDSTLYEIRKLCKNNINIKGVDFSKNFGQHSAMQAAFTFVTGDIVIYSDDDGQTPINELNKLLLKLDEGYDMVCAKFDVKKNSIIQNLGTKVNNLMAQILIEKPKEVHMGNFWICKQFIVKESIKCQNPYPYLAGVFLGITRNIAMVNTGHRPRKYGKSNYTFSKMFALWLNGFTAFSIKPLRIASLFGLLVSMIGFFYLFYVILNKINNPDLPMGYSSIMSALLIIGGFILIMLGLIGEYVGRIYININNKPQFVIKEIINI